MSFKTSKRFAFAVAATLLLSASGAQAADYVFTQTGFSGGGSLSGSFSGVDLDLDGLLDASFGELSAFTLNFSGDRVIADFSLGLGDLAGLSFDLNQGMFLGDNGEPNTGEGIGAFKGDLVYLSGVGPTGAFDPGAASIGGFVMDFNGITVTASPISVSAVPEPETYALFLAGLGLLGFAGKGRRARN